jgi:hypothetical protein
MNQITNTSEETEELSIDPMLVIEHIRRNLRIPPEARAALEDAHQNFETLKTIYSDDPQVTAAIIHAFGYGLAIGSYVNGLDEKVLERTDKLLSRHHQSLRGKKSAEKRVVKPWHAPAADLAIKLRGDNPRWSQVQLAEKISAHLKLTLPARKDRVGVDTLKDFISALEREGRLVRRQNLGGRTGSPP